LLSNIAKEFSIHKIFNSLKSEGMKISKDSLYKYLGYCEDAYLLFTVSIFSETLAKQTRKKCYSIDTGLSSLISFSVSQDAGRLFENMIALEIKRRGNELYFYKENCECDFIVKEKDVVVEAIQVCYVLDETNKEREIKGLQEAMKRFNLKEGIIITKDQEEKYENIKLIPAWKWLLKEEKEKIIA
jgi:predicted AAA+ superfamily ATPase